MSEDLPECLAGWVKAIDITVSNQNRFEWYELRSLQGTLKCTIPVIESQAERIAELEAEIDGYRKFLSTAGFNLAVVDRARKV